MCFDNRQSNLEIDKLLINNLYNFKRYKIPTLIKTIHRYQILEFVGYVPIDYLRLINGITNKKKKTLHNFKRVILLIFYAD